MTRDLFGDVCTARREPESLGPGAVLLPGWAAPQTSFLMSAIKSVAERAPFRNMTTPGGYRMSVAMTNCGAAGWVADRGGYRYDALDPLSGKRWPTMPDTFFKLAAAAAARAGFAGFAPDACLINRHEPGARLSLHQDKNERNYAAPIVSVSLGLP